MTDTNTFPTNTPLGFPLLWRVRGGLGGGFSAVILAAGDFPTHVLPLHILRTAENLIVCDGALEDLLEYEIEPTAVVGDGDSLSEELKQRYAHIYHPISEQEFNDLTKATLFARSHLKMDAIYPYSSSILLPRSNWQA